MRRLKVGDKVVQKSSGKKGTLTDIQYVHNRYQFGDVSGWLYGIHDLVLQGTEEVKELRELAVKAWVFNPELLRKIVFITGRDEEGNNCEVKGIVSEALGDEIEIRSVLNSDVTYRFSLGEFHPEGLKLVAWDGPPNEYTFNAEEGEGAE